jgi:hypothetical protein
LACAALARALNIRILLTSRKSSWVAQAEPCDKLASVRNPFRAGVAPQLNKCAVRHDVVGELPVQVTWFVNEGRLPVIVGAEAHVLNPLCTKLNRDLLPVTFCRRLAFPETLKLSGPIQVLKLFN